jgi:PIF1-like helicase
LRSPDRVIYFNTCSSIFIKVRLSYLISVITLIISKSIVGPDRAYFRVSAGEEERINEIDDFWNGRYHSATEATWRILGYGITKKTPSVTSLPVHLPNAIHNRRYTTNGGTGSLSSLERYFLRPDGTFEIDGAARSFSDLLYSEYFKLFYLKSYDPVKALTHPEWFSERPPPPNVPHMHVILRSHKNPHITRLQSIRLSLGDVFYLRALLQTRPVRSFEELRTVNGTIYHSFHEAAIALNLFTDETEAEYCLTEAVESLRTPYQMRLLFIHMLTNDCVTSPLTIWEKFRNSLSEDFYFSNGRDWWQAFSEALLQISANLQEHGKTPEDYGLPQPERFGNEIIAESQRWSPQIPQLLSAAQYALSVFTPEQRQIFDLVWNAIELDQPLRLFVDGRAGRGKTFLVNSLCSQVRGHGGIVLATASSGFAAQLYPGGRTTHSTFKVSTIVSLYL